MKITASALQTLIGVRKSVLGELAQKRTDVTEISIILRLTEKIAARGRIRRRGKILQEVANRPEPMRSTKSEETPLPSAATALASVRVP